MKVVTAYYSNGGQVWRQFLESEYEEADRQFKALSSAWQEYHNGMRTGKFFQTHDGEAIFRLDDICAIQLQHPTDEAFEIARRVCMERFEQRVNEAVREAIGKVGFK